MVKSDGLNLSLFIYRLFGIADEKEQEIYTGLNRVPNVYQERMVQTMKKEDFVKLGIDEETAERCASASAEELKGFIPKARFDEVNNEKKKLELDVRDRDGQLETLKNSSGDLESMKKQIEELQSSNKKAADEYAAQLKQMKIDAAVDLALAGAGAKNSKAVKALLKNLENAELQEDGTVKGLSDQISALQKSDDYLFNSTTNTPKQMKGMQPGQSGNEPGNKAVDTSKMTYSELAAYMAENPDAKID